MASIRVLLLTLSHLGSCARSTWPAGSRCAIGPVGRSSPTSHSHPVPAAALDLLSYALIRHRPQTIIVERDDRLDQGQEILDDVARIRACVKPHGTVDGEAALGSPV